VRVLWALAIVQTACLGFLTFKLVVGTSAEEAGPPRPSAAETRVIHVTAAETGGAGGRLDEERLRRVIREELAQSMLGAAVGATPEALPPAAPARDETRDTERRAQVERQLAHYRSVGTIGDREMLELQAAIAELGERDRKDMMSKLLRALSAGEIDGRLR
jgi:hypothetical protein